MINITYKSIAKLINNRPFTVVIDRGEAYRRYRIMYTDTYEMLGKPLSPEDFVNKYGFSVEWPYEKDGN